LTWENLAAHDRGQPTAGVARGAFAPGSAATPFAEGPLGALGLTVTLLHAVMVGAPVGAILTAMLWIFARRDLLRRFQQTPPPAELGDRYTRRPMRATFGVSIFVWLFMGLSLAATALAYVVLAGLD